MTNRKFGKILLGVVVVHTVFELAYFTYKYGWYGLFVLFKVPLYTGAFLLGQHHGLEAK